MHSIGTNNRHGGHTKSLSCGDSMTWSAKLVLCGINGKIVLKLKNFLTTIQAPI